MSDECTEIENCVKKYLTKQNICLCKMKIDCNESDTIHFMSKIAKVEIQGKDENGQNINLSLIVKLTKSGEGYRNKIPIRVFFNNEIYLYEHVFPLFQELQRKKKITDVFKSYANFCESSKEEYNEMIVLENMTKRGFQHYKKIETLDYDHALLLVKEVGRLHALSFAIFDQQPHEFDKIKNDIEEAEFHSIGESNRVILKAIFPECIQTLDSVKDKIAIDRYKRFEEVFFERIQKSVEASSAGQYAVVTHCDLWVSNLLFKYDHLMKPSEICMLDWQLTKVASPACDLSEILLMSINKKTRDKHYYDLVDAYYTSFASFLRQLGSNPDELFPYNVLEEHLAKFSVHALYIALRLISITSMKETVNFSEKDSFEKLANTKEETSTFTNTIRDILLDYLMYGYEL